MISMKEILGYNLEKFFRRIEYPCDGGVFERTYKGTDYEIYSGSVVKTKI